MPAFRKQGRRWLRKPPARVTPTEARDVEADIELEAKRFRDLAPALGFCGACGISVDEANGKLHDKDCPYLPAERRRAS